MNCRSKACTCGHKQFDAETAFRRLAAKYDQLAQLMANFIATAASGPPAALSSDAPTPDDLTTIVGGVPIAATELPECCVIGNRSGSSTQWFCTGVLVHPKIVLTAAHCMSSSRPANIVAFRAAKISDLAGAEIVRVRRALGHPDWETLNDIAVLVLRTAATTPPVPIASAAELANAFQTTLAGFGNDDVFSTRGFGVKRKVNVAITHLRRAADDDLAEAEDTLGFESDLEFVAGGGGFDSCNGDSGGPAYIMAGGQRKVAGLTSRATNTAETPCGDGGIYTRVDTQMSFIKSVAADFGITL
jgi:endonuclease G